MKIKLIAAALVAFSAIAAQASDKNSTEISNSNTSYLQKQSVDSFTLLVEDKAENINGVINYFLKNPKVMYAYAYKASNIPKKDFDGIAKEFGLDTTYSLLRIALIQAIYDGKISASTNAAYQASLDEKIFAELQSVSIENCSKVEIKNEIIKGTDCFDQNFGAVKVITYDKSTKIATSEVEDADFAKKKITQFENENVELAARMKMMVPSLTHSNDFKVTTFSLDEFFSFLISEKEAQK